MALGLNCLPVLFMHPWVFSWYTNFNSKNMHSGLTGLFNLPIGVGVCMHCCLSGVSQCFIVIDFQSDHGPLCLLTIDLWR